MRWDIDTFWPNTKRAQVTVWEASLTEAIRIVDFLKMEFPNQEITLTMLFRIGSQHHACLEITKVGPSTLVAMGIYFQEHKVDLEDLEVIPIGTQ